jgi:Gram-negative bacterial TonB protein C-terminal
VMKGISCPTQPPAATGDDFPRKALQEQITGTITVQATVNPDGSVSGPRIVRQSGMSSAQARMFQSFMFSHISRYKCGQRDSPGAVEVEYVWKLE